MVHFSGDILVPFRGSVKPGLGQSDPTRQADQQASQPAARTSSRARQDFILVLYACLEAGDNSQRRSAPGASTPGAGRFGSLLGLRCSRNCISAAFFSISTCFASSNSRDRLFTCC
jgi:hypothetical protein